jgi:gamma-glutamylputrescine oxidase
MSISPLPDVNSLWQATEAGRPRLPRLQGAQQADVVIIGGGFTGLSTARYVAALGLNPVVVEANRIGWGASGRNGGVVEGKYRLSFSDMHKRFGADVARRMHHIGNEAVDHVAELVEAYGLASADYRQNGNAHCAHTELALQRLLAESRWMEATFGEKEIVLSADEIAAELGTRSFCGGVLNPRGGTIHPLNYVLGLAAGMHKAGVSIFEETPVLSLRTEREKVIVETPQGSVSANHAVIATNSYSDLTAATDRVKRAIVPFRSAMVVTEPLGDLGLKATLSFGRSYTETRRMMRWFRRTGDRILYGGRGAFGKTDSEAAFQALEAALRKQFPQIGAARITHRWSGLVALTLDRMPHLGWLDNRICYAMGYNGLGVAMSSLMGKYTAKLVAGESPDLGLITAKALRPIPLYPLREIAVRGVAGWYQFLDAAGL